MGRPGAGDAGFGPAWSATRRLGSEAELRGWLELAMAICDEADEIARAHFRRDLVIATKPDRSFVTQADQAIERVIRARIADVHPAHGLVGEEYGVEQGGASVRWYIDPIDATNNFIRGVPIFGTLLGIERDGEMQVGVMSAPAMRERWFAWRGGGAWSRGLDGERRIRTSAVAALSDAQVLYGSASDNRTSGVMPGFDDLVAAAWRERGFGDFWGYALVAEGAAEAMVETDLSSWDMAAPLVVVEESGGRLTDIDGRRRIDAGSCVASNGHLHETILARLRGPDGVEPDA
jgi:histidinol-phosphatase